MKIFENGTDNGYMDELNWWDNPSNPQAFRIGKLSDDYPAVYFNNGHGLDNNVIISYCNYVPEYFEKITKRKLVNIVEYGSAGAWFSNRFKQLGYEIQTLDGADDATSQVKRDFRKVAFKEPLSVKPYDIALCTEVAEHLEPPFAGILVHNLICESDVIWWSSAVRGRGRPHLHHPNEQPIQYWVNLFDFHGYGCYMLSDSVNEACGSRGRCLFYNKSVYTEKFD
jgi:hypothetical protein